MPAYRPAVYRPVDCSVNTQVIYILTEIHDRDIDFDQPTTVCMHWTIRDPLLPVKDQWI